MKAFYFILSSYCVITDDNQKELNYEAKQLLIEAVCHVET